MLLCRCGGAVRSWLVRRPTIRSCADDIGEPYAHDGAVIGLGGALSARILYCAGDAGHEGRRHSISLPGRLTSCKWKTTRPHPAHTRSRTNYSSQTALPAGFTKHLPRASPSTPARQSLSAGTPLVSTRILSTSTSMPQVLFVLSFTSGRTSNTMPVATMPLSRLDGGTIPRPSACSSRLSRPAHLFSWSTDPPVPSSPRLTLAQTKTAPQLLVQLSRWTTIRRANNMVLPREASPLP